MDLKKLILLLLPISFTVYGQQNNNWYFGAQAAMTFNGGAPASLLNSAMDAPEGCSSISDKSGNLLFYTNGVTVYNKNHQVMLNGTGLLGHVSAFQSCVIVPVPNNDSLFYIFTNDAWEDNFANGYRYSIVNMNHDNGKGEVILKNGPLSLPSSERLTAARHANGVDVWVIGNDKSSATFRCWLVTCNGLQPTPVVSTVGAVMNQHEEMNFGCLKVSPDGKQLCQTHFPELDGFIPENFFQLFDFDNATGVISNPRQISVPNNRYYACEYSPDSKLLYVSKAQTNVIDQFEATLGTATQIINSRIPVPADFGCYGMQVGPDKQIYIAANRNRLSVISQPNTKGVGCNFIKDEVLLGSYAGINLPAAINDLAVNANVLYQIVDSCNGVVQFTAQTTMGGSLQYSWDFGDGNTSTAQNPLHDFLSATQVYKVKLKIISSTACGFVEQSVNIVPGGAVAKAAFDFVAKCDSGYVRFVNNSVFSGGIPQYTWDFGDNNSSSDKDPVHAYAGSGNFVVKLKISIGQNCLADSITKTVNLQQLNIQVPSTQTIDAGQSVQLFVNGGANHFQWTPTTGLSDPTVANPVATPRMTTTYVVTASNDAGCVDIDSVLIKVNPIDGIYVPSAFTPNNDGKNDLLRATIGLNLTLIKFSIYNRWGQKVFETRQNEKGWDGKFEGTLQASGGFVWMISVKDQQGKLMEKKGSFVLIR